MITCLRRVIPQLRSGLVECRIGNTLSPALVRGLVSAHGMSSQVVYPPARDPSAKNEDKSNNDLVKGYALETLRSLKGFLRRVNNDDYSHVDVELRGSIGQHFRHVSDHFDKILEKIGHENAIIDFDNRQPGGILEQDYTVALDQVDTLKNKICNITSDELNQAVTVAFMAHPREYGSDCKPRDPDCFQIPSTIARELSFATHHAIHHTAFIALLARRLKYDVHEDFGMNPSTVHRLRKKGVL